MSFQYKCEEFSDIRVLRYQIPNFDKLSDKNKELAYYLCQSCLAGRDIFWDQNFKYNLKIRNALESIFKQYPGDRKCKEWEHFHTYLKRIWVANGIHHHYSNKKIKPGFSEEYFEELLSSTIYIYDLDNLKHIIFNPKTHNTKVEQSSEGSLVMKSSVNYYDDCIKDDDVKTFYNSQKTGDGVSKGLNSKLVWDNDVSKLQEQKWTTNNMYAVQLKQVVYWLEKAVNVAEPIQQSWLNKLIEFYNTGDLNIHKEYQIEWLKDVDSPVDMIQGFIETYNDPLGFKGSFEGIVYIKDLEGCKRVKILQDNAQWFESNLPTYPHHKRDIAKGVNAYAINVICEVGDSSPITPIGVNLPNNKYLKENYGSKSITLSNIINAYNEADKSSGLLEEFTLDKEIYKILTEHGELLHNLSVDIHECLGHASGKLEKDVNVESLGVYGHTLEEARADLVALYYIYHPKLVELGVVPSRNVAKAEYNEYLTNGLLSQLKRIQLGEDLEESHMRNRQLICKWVLEKCKSVSLIKSQGKHYVNIEDYEKLMESFGDLLREIQRITSQGDYQSAKKLVEKYGIKIDRELHKEVLERVKKYNIKPFSAMLNPVITMIQIGNTDKSKKEFKIEYPNYLTSQMLYYSQMYNY